MNLTTDPTNRRTFLRTGGNVLALPFLGSLLPAAVTAAQEKRLAEEPIKRLL